MTDAITAAVDRLRAAKPDGAPRALDQHSIQPDDLEVADPREAGGRTLRLVSP